MPRAQVFVDLGSHNSRRPTPASDVPSVVYNLLWDVPFPDPPPTCTPVAEIDSDGDFFLKDALIL